VITWDEGWIPIASLLRYELATPHSGHFVFTPLFGAIRSQCLGSQSLCVLSNHEGVLQMKQDGVPLAHQNSLERRTVSVQKDF
jgi:hypothetical protein